MSLPIHKDLRALCRQALKQGCTVTQLGSGHFEIAKGGARVVISSTPNSSAIRDARRKVARLLSGKGGNADDAPAPEGESVDAWPGGSGKNDRPTGNVPCPTEEGKDL